jgi:hypothetical protein
MSDLFDEKFAEQDELGQQPPEFPDEFVQPLQELVVTGHLTDTFTYGGQEFTIHTMTIGEELEALRAAKRYDDLPIAAGRVYATAMVAGAVQILNGEPIVIPISEKQDIAALRFRKVMKWFWPVIEQVYLRYANLEKQQKEVLDSLESSLEDADTQESPDPVE